MNYVYLKNKKNNTIYVYESVGRWDKEKKMCVCDRKCVGKLDFFLRQSRHRMETEYLIYDTTSISSYSQSLKQVKYGKNREHDLLAQINLALLMGEKSGLPVYYRKLPGNITDVKTLKNLTREIEFLEIAKVKVR